MIVFRLKVVPPGHQLPGDIVMTLGDTLDITLTFHGEMDMISRYTYTATATPVRIVLEHFDIEYPEGYAGAVVVFTKS